MTDNPGKEPGDEISNYGTDQSRTLRKHKSSGSLSSVIENFPTQSTAYDAAFSKPPSPIAGISRAGSPSAEPIPKRSRRASDAGMDYETYQKHMKRPITPTQHGDTQVPSSVEGETSTLPDLFEYLPKDHIVRPTTPVGAPPEEASDDEGDMVMTGGPVLADVATLNPAHPVEGGNASHTTYSTVATFTDPTSIALPQTPSGENTRNLPGSTDNAGNVIHTPYPTLDMGQIPSNPEVITTEEAVNDDDNNGDTSFASQGSTITNRTILIAPGTPTQPERAPPSPTPSITNIERLPSQIRDIRPILRGPEDTIQGVLAAIQIKAGSKAQKVIHEKPSLEQVIFIASTTAVDMASGLEAAAENTRTKPEMYQQVTYARAQLRYAYLEAIRQMDRQSEADAKMGLPVESVPTDAATIAGNLQELRKDNELRWGAFVEGLREEMQIREDRIIERLMAGLNGNTGSRTLANNSSCEHAHKPDSTQRPTQPQAKPKPAQATTTEPAKVATLTKAPAKVISINITPKAPLEKETKTLFRKRAPPTNMVATIAEREEKRRNLPPSTESIEIAKAMRAHLATEEMEDVIMNAARDEDTCASFWADEPPPENVNPAGHPPIIDEHGREAIPYLTRDDEEVIIGFDDKTYDTSKPRESENPDDDFIEVTKGKGKAHGQKPKPSFADMAKANTMWPAPWVPTVNAAAIIIACRAHERPRPQYATSSPLRGSPRTTR